MSRRSNCSPPVASYPWSARKAGRRGSGSSHIQIAGHLVVERHVLVACRVAGPGGDRATRMLVELAGDHVLHVRTPFDLAAKRQEMFLQDLVDRPQLELGVPQ